MLKLFDNYLKIMRSKREYKSQMTRVLALPKDYQYVFKRIRNHMWMFAAGTGYDMIKIHCDLVELFEEGAANGQHVLEITGGDVAAFCDELLRSTTTYTGKWRKSLNRDIQRKFIRRGD